jgi:hypothetical protein
MGYMGHAHENGPGRLSRWFCFDNPGFRRRQRSETGPLDSARLPRIAPRSEGLRMKTSWGIDLCSLTQFVEQSPRTSASCTRLRNIFTSQESPLAIARSALGSSILLGLLRATACEYNKILLHGKTNFSVGNLPLLYERLPIPYRSLPQKG